MGRGENPDRGVAGPRAGPVVRPLVPPIQFRSRHYMAGISDPVRKQDAIQMVEFVLNTDFGMCLPRERWWLALIQLFPVTGGE